MRLKNKIILLSFAFFFCANCASADSVGDRRSFYVDEGYDAEKRSAINAMLVKSGSRADIYVDEIWWNFTSQAAVREAINNLSNEFDNRIYTTLTNIFGQEWNPGIDKNYKITILVQAMSGNTGGYFRTNDEYSKLLISDSNEKEMIYINSKYVLDLNFKSFVAHEFVHLITFNQKNIKYGVEEDTWLNEARAEYAPTMLGYNDIYNNSYLEKRVQSFLEKPSGSLVDFDNEESSYSAINLFTHYLVDQYGFSILIDSLHSSEVGISSVNQALEKNGFGDRFSKIFTNWTITVLINDCDYGANYCYLDKNLKNFYLNPVINFLPISGNSTLTTSDNIKVWAGSWYKIIGGGGGYLKFYFQGDPKASFKVPYIEKNKAGAYTINFMEIDGTQKGEFYIKDFGKEVISLFVLPVLQQEISFSSNRYYSIFWSASITRSDNDLDEISRLLKQIAELKNEIAKLQNQNYNPTIKTCAAIVDNLYFGLQNNNQVRCLQEFLKNQGASIYPEGFVTGNFGNFTKQAVTRFQERYVQEILAPWGLSVGTGRVGPSTRNKINQIISSL